MSNVAVFQWMARVSAAALALFWGAFFLSHVGEWFSNGQDPPSWVWAAMLLHGTMIAGLLMLFLPGRTLWGSIVTVAATVAFFGVIELDHFPAIALLNAVPIALLVAARLLSGRDTSVVQGSG